MRWTRPMPHCRDHLQTKKCVTNHTAVSTVRCLLLYFILHFSILFIIYFVLFSLGEGCKNGRQIWRGQGREWDWSAWYEIREESTKSFKIMYLTISWHLFVFLICLRLAKLLRTNLKDMCLIPIVLVPANSSFRAFMYFKPRLVFGCLQRRLVPGKHPLPCLCFVTLDQVKKRITERLGSRLPLCWKLLPSLQQLRLLDSPASTPSKCALYCRIAFGFRKIMKHPKTYRWYDACWNRWFRVGCGYFTWSSCSLTKSSH